VLIAQPISVHGLALDRDRAPALPKAEELRLAEQKTALLPASVLPDVELRDAELTALWDAASPRAQAAIGLLLAGLSPEEVGQLEAAQLDPTGRLRVAGASPREIALPPAVAAVARRATEAGGRLYPGGDAAAAREGLDADLLCAAHDAGLAEADTVTPEVLRHTYLLHLVRQGARMSDITAIAGRLPPAVISAYAGYAPAGPRVALDAARAVFPLLDRLPA
jgi:integrase